MPKIKAPDLSVNRLCCDPENRHPRQKRSHGLRLIRDDIIKSRSDLNIKKGSKVCTLCRKKLKCTTLVSSSETTDEPSTSSSAPTIHPPSSSSEEKISSSADAESSDSEIVEKNVSLSLLNESLKTFGESPFKKRLASSSKKYSSSKARKVQTLVRKQLEYAIGATPMTTTRTTTEEDYNEIMDQLKDKFENASLRSEKIKILTVLPKSWTIRKTQEIFDTTYRMARNAKILAHESGILSDPNPRTGTKTLKPETVRLVVDFYSDDRVSRVMPGIKDCISVNIDGQKVSKQKRLILCNLKEAYELFKEVYPDEKVGFSKFASLRPKECILVGAKGTHTVCVCIIHQNTKLLFIHSKLVELTKETEPSFSEYKHCLAVLTCSPPSLDCISRKCMECSNNGNKLREILTNIYDTYMIDEVEVRRWISTDRASLEKSMKSVEDFVDLFVQQLETLVIHDYIAKMQAAFARDKKIQLGHGEFLIIGDFSENMSFVIQDEVQSFHWNNAQATIHPFVAYYKEDSEVKHVSLVIISDCSTHDTIAVHLFQRHLIQFLMTKFTVKKIFYFSDGCAAQYKNRKNFTNLCYHEDDFGVPAEWHFFATSHGKGPCDGIGGTIKRLATKASLQRPYKDQILTHSQLYEWCRENIKTVTFKLLTTAQWQEEGKILMTRFKDARTIPGTQKFHSFVPVPGTLKLECRETSISESYIVEPVMKTEQSLQNWDLQGYVTCVYEGKWWLALILKVDAELEEATLKFLHPSGPAASFKFPEVDDVLNLHFSDILASVNPATPTGRFYTLSKKETSAAKTALMKRK